MINLGWVPQNSTFGQSFEVETVLGTWFEGEFVPTDPPKASITKHTGTVYASTPKEIQSIPEGERVTEMVTFISPKSISTRNEGTFPDVILWRGSRYKILSSHNWLDYGFNVAIGGLI